MALSPVIRGWCNYYRYAVAKRTFCAPDDQPDTGIQHSTGCDNWRLPPWL